MQFEESETVFHFRLKKSDNPELYDAIISRKKGQRSQYIRSILIDNYDRRGGDHGLQDLLEKLIERGEYQTELLIGLQSLLKDFCGTAPGAGDPAEKKVVKAEHRVDPGMSQNMIEMYATLNAE